MRKKNIGLLAFAILAVAVLSQSYANVPAPQIGSVSADKPFFSGINVTRQAVSFENALDALVNPIEQVSVYEDCNRNPEKYDIWDGKLMLDNAPCFSNACIEEKITIHGTSMEPTIHNGQTVYVRTRDSNYNLSVGRIIAYDDSLGQNEGTYDFIVHRVVGIENENVKIERIGNNYFVRTNDALNTTFSWQANRFMENIERPYYIVRGDNNDGCEIVPRNIISGVLSGVG